MLSDSIESGRIPNIGVLINPLSGGNLSGLGSIRNVINENPRVIHRDVRTPQDVLDALLDFARRDVDLLAVNGGDGTVQAVLTNLFLHQPFSVMPLLAVLQSGTTSMTARDVGFSGSPVKSLQKLFKWATTGDAAPKVIQRPVLEVQAPGHQTYYGMFFGASAIYQGIEYFHRKINTKGLRGQLGPGITILRFLWSAIRSRSGFIPPIPVSATVDDKQPQNFDSFVVLISTLERLFFGIHPYWGVESGPLHYTAVRAYPRHLLMALPAVLCGRRGNFGTIKNGFYSHNAHEVKLFLEGGFTLDGQLYTPENREKPTVVRYGGMANFIRI
jgi:hypothetical protein